MKNLFTEIDQTIRKEKLYADAELKRSTIMQRFKISRHRLNALLAIHTGGLSFPQYINTIRMAETKQLLIKHSLSVARSNLFRRPCISTKVSMTFSF